MHEAPTRPCRFGRHAGASRAVLPMKRAGAEPPPGETSISLPVCGPGAVDPRDHALIMPGADPGFAEDLNGTRIGPVPGMPAVMSSSRESDGWAPFAFFMPRTFIWTAP